MIAEGRSCPKKEDYDVLRALAASFARLQSLHLVTLKSDLKLNTLLYIAVV